MTLLAAFLPGALLLPLGEELFFRGAVQGFLRGRMSPAAAIVAAAGVAALPYLALRTTPILMFGFGYVLGWVRERSGSLVAPALAHIGWAGAVMGLSLLTRLF